MEADQLKGKRVAIYARYSSGQQRETSIDDQVRLCRRFVEASGGAVAEDRVFADYAVSGASLARPSFEKLYAMVQASPPQVDVVVTENTDRIGRDTSDGMRFLKHLQFSGVRLICVNDGIDSSQKGSQLAFGIKALFAEQYLHDLRDKTLRGLEGQALRGYSTGGLPYGYKSRPLGTHSRPDAYEIVVDEPQAEVVRRIFRMYASGESYLTIARTLHTEGAPIPRAHTKHRKPGWISSTVREILHHEKYIGRWTFKVKEWRKIPGTNIRRYRARPADEVLVQERPHLRIIDEELWAAVQQRLRGVAAKYRPFDKPREATGHGRAGRPTKYPFSGLLFCGGCGGPFTIIGGSPHRFYGCGDRAKRGICGVRQKVRADLVSQVLLGEVRRLVLGPAGIKYARERLGERLEELSRGRDAELMAARDRLAELDRKIQKLVSFITTNDEEDEVVLGPVRAQLKELGGQASGVRQRLAALQAQAERPLVLPSADEIERRVFDLEALVEASPLGAREALGRLFQGGRITMHLEEGAFVAKSALIPGVLLDKTQTPQPGAEACIYCSGCAGRI